MEDMIERTEVVAYLRHLAGYAEKGMSQGFRERHDDLDRPAMALLAAGLLAAADQIESRKIDTKRWA